MLVLCVASSPPGFAGLPPTAHPNHLLLDQLLKMVHGPEGCMPALSNQSCGCCVSQAHYLAVQASHLTASNLFEPGQLLLLCERCMLLLTPGSASQPPPAHSTRLLQGLHGFERHAHLVCQKLALYYIELQTFAYAMHVMFCVTIDTVCASISVAGLTCAEINCMCLLAGSLIS